MPCRSGRCAGEPTDSEPTMRRFVSMTAAALLALGGAACERNGMDEPGDMSDMDDEMAPRDDGEEM